MKKIFSFAFLLYLFLTTALSASSSGSYFVLTYNVDGTFLGSLPMEKPQWNVVGAIDSEGNTYIVGSGSQGCEKTDVIITKYGRGGEIVWKRQIGTPDYDFAGGVAVDFADNVYVVGTTNGIMDGNTSEGLADNIVVKFDRSGNQQWIRQFGTPAYEQEPSIAIDINSDIYITSATKLGNGGGSDVLVAKYDSEGIRKWMIHFGDVTRNEASTGIKVDSNGQVNIFGKTW